MTLYIIVAAAVLVLLAVMLAAGTSMFFKVAVLSDNYKKTRPKLAWDENEDRPDEVMFNPNCLPYRDELIEGRKWVKSHELAVYETVSYDGLKLRARYLPAEPLKGIVLMMHGFRSNPLHDFSLAIKEYHEMGIGCFMPYQRAHGDSEGKYLCYGVKERYDVVSWCEFIGKTFPGVRVLLDGISMGAATVMMAAGEVLPDFVRCIVADSGYTSPEAIMKSVMKSHVKMSPFPFYYTTALYAKLRAHFSFGEASTLDALKKNRLPILIAHGQGDTLVPHSMSEQNYAVAREYCDAEFISVPGAEHGLSFMVDREKYLNAVRKLVNDYILK
ncbi:MAG: alpha/beta hydrolase [Clostridia bacterium]|nr:alpha/beta hydrolase [Clostridia bacterium]